MFLLNSGVEVERIRNAEVRGLVHEPVQDDDLHGPSLREEAAKELDASSPSPTTVS